VLLSVRTTLRPSQRISFAFHSPTGFSAPCFAGTTSCSEPFNQAPLYASRFNPGNKGFRVDQLNFQSQCGGLARGRAPQGNAVVCTPIETVIKSQAKIAIRPFGQQLVCLVASLPSSDLLV